MVQKKIYESTLEGTYKVGAAASAPNTSAVAGSEAFDLALTSATIALNNEDFVTYANSAPDAEDGFCKKNDWVKDEAIDIVVADCGEDFTGLEKGKTWHQIYKASATEVQLGNAEDRANGAGSAADKRPTAFEDGSVMTK